MAEDGAIVGIPPAPLTEEDKAAMARALTALSEKASSDAAGAALVEEQTSGLFDFWKPVDASVSRVGAKETQDFYETMQGRRDRILQSGAHYDALDFLQSIDDVLRTSYIKDATVLSNSGLALGQIARDTVDDIEAGVSNAVAAVEKGVALGGVVILALVVGAGLILWKQGFPKVV